MVRPWVYDSWPLRPAFAEAMRIIADKGTGRPIFSAERQSDLRLGKYSRWACDIREDRLLAVLSLVGEYGALAHVIAEQLNRYQGEVELRLAYARIRGDLDVICEFVRGSRYTLDEVCGRVKMARRKAENSRFKSSADWWTAKES